MNILKSQVRPPLTEPLTQPVALEGVASAKLGVKDILEDRKNDIDKKKKKHSKKTSKVFFIASKYLYAIINVFTSQEQAPLMEQLNQPVALDSASSAKLGAADIDKERKPDIDKKKKESNETSKVFLKFQAYLCHHDLFHFSGTSSL